MEIYSIRIMRHNIVEIKKLKIIKETEKTITISKGRYSTRIKKVKFLEGDKLYYNYNCLYGTDLNLLINRFNEYKNLEIEQYRKKISDNEKQKITSKEIVINTIKNGEIYRKNEE